MPGLYYFLVFYIYSRMRLTSFLQAVAFYVLQLENVRSWYGKRISPDWRTYVFRMENIKCRQKKMNHQLPEKTFAFAFPGEFDWGGRLKGYGCLIVGCKVGLSIKLAIYFADASEKANFAGTEN